MRNKDDRGDDVLTPGEATLHPNKKRDGCERPKVALTLTGMTVLVSTSRKHQSRVKECAWQRRQTSIATGAGWSNATHEKQRRLSGRGRRVLEFIPRRPTQSKIHGLVGSFLDRSNQEGVLAEFVAELGVNSSIRSGFEHDKTFGETDLIWICGVCKNTDNYWMAKGSWRRFDIDKRLNWTVGWSTVDGGPLIRDQTKWVYVNVHLRAGHLEHQLSDQRVRRVLSTQHSSHRPSPRF